MARAKLTITTAHSSDDPFCPHCGADMGAATVTLGDIMRKWPLGGFVHVREDGYTHPGDYVETECLECMKPSAVRIDGGDVTLIAARTETDKSFLGEV